MSDRSKRVDRRAATPQEIAALASSTRLRMLRLTLESPMTNGELANRLGLSPATSHYHVRKLLESGLLQALAPRTRTTGGYEIPYRSNGRSWTLEISGEDRPNNEMIAAFLAELHESGTGSLAHATRLRTRLTDRRRAELITRMRQLWDDFADDQDGDAWSLFFAMHADRA